MNIIPDPTMVLLQLVPFLVTLFALHKIIFTPMLDYLEERQAAIDGGLKEASDLQGQISAKMDEYERRLAEARGAAAELRASHRNAAKDQYNVVLAEVRSETEAEIAAAVAEIEKELAAAREQLDATSRALASDIAGQVLGRDLAQGA